MFSVSLGEIKKLRICVGAGQCEIIGRGRYNGSDACEPDGKPIRFTNVMDLER